MASKLTTETLSQIKNAQGTPLAKDALDNTFGGTGEHTSGANTTAFPSPAGFNTGLGLNYFDLEAPAKSLYPVLTPLRNRIARVRGDGGTATRWRAITDINIAKEQMGISEGQRSRRIQTQTKEYIASYKGLGLEDSVTFESTYADDGFDDVRARATEGLLRSVMIGEEQVILGGNSSLQLGTCPTPTQLSTGTIPSGSLTAGNTVSVKCVALTQDGYYRASLSAAGVIGAVSRVNADGTTDTYGGGASQISAAASLTVASAKTACKAQVAQVRGAVAYAWYWDVGGTTERLSAITTTNVVEITAAESSSNQLASDSSISADASTNSLVYDGLLSQIFTASNNSYFKALDAEGVLTGGDGGINEIEEALRHFWDTYKLSPSEIIVSAEQLNDMTKLLVSNNANTGAQFAFNIDGNGGVSERTISAGTVIGQYLNKYSMNGASMLPIRIHPYLAPGTIMFLSDSLPYPTTNIGTVMQIKTRREYTQIEWPLRTRTYEFGIYLDAVLQHYAPFSMGCITNIKKQA